MDREGSHEKGNYKKSALRAAKQLFYSDDVIKKNKVC